MNTIEQNWPQIALLVTLGCGAIWLIYDLRNEYKDMKKQDAINKANMDLADLELRNNVRSNQARRNLKVKYKVNK